MGKSSKQTTENKPPAWATPLFSQSASEASKIYNSGAGGNVYQGQTVANLGQTTQQGIQGVQNAAGNWNNQQFQNMLTAPTQSSQNLQGMASGQYLQEGNPYYRDRLNNEIAQANSLVQSQFSGSGRYGSGANTDVLSRNTNNMLLQGLESDYNRAMGNMLSANQMIDQSNNAQVGNMMNAYQGQQAAQQGVINAGQLQDQNAQQQLTADFTKWQSEDMAPWTRLGLLQSAAAGSAGNYGTNTQTATQPFNALQGIGAVGSLFTGKSDIRLKEAIEPVGWKNGFTVYEFTYTGKPDRLKGVMAQEVVRTRPEAVIIEDDGFYAVHYGMLGMEMEAA